MKNSDAFHVMAKPSGSICNMDCEYCFYLEKKNLYPETNHGKMDYATLEIFVHDYIEAQKIPTINFLWQGGEPTLVGIDYFKKVVELQRKYSNGKKIQNSFQTNGVLLNDEWCDFFYDNDFLVGVSIDGPKEIHDKYRFLIGGKSTFSKVIMAIELLHKHDVKFNTLTCVNKANQDKPIEVYDFLKSIGGRFLQFIPVVERIAVDKEETLRLVKPGYGKNAQVSEWSVEPPAYGNFLNSIFDYWVRSDVAEIFVQIFDVALESYYGYEQSLCVFKDKCGDALALEHNGDLYSCDHYVYPDNMLGNILRNNISELIDSEQQIKFGEHKFNSLPGYCLSCDVRFACNGECPKHRFAVTPDGEPGLNYLCPSYKNFFNHIAPYMNFMVSELKHGRPPANVMEWIRQKEKQSEV